MIFDHNGNFVDECNFSDYNTGSRYTNNLKESLNKMVLSKYSNDSMYYIFLDESNLEFRIYKLID